MPQSHSSIIFSKLPASFFGVILIVFVTRFFLPPLECYAVDEILPLLSDTLGGHFATAAAYIELTLLMCCCYIRRHLDTESAAHKAESCRFSKKNTSKNTHTVTSIKVLLLLVQTLLEGKSIEQIKVGQCTTLQLSERQTAKIAAIVYC